MELFCLLVITLFSSVHSLSNQIDSRNRDISFGSLLRNNLRGDLNSKTNPEINNGSNNLGWQYWCDSCVCGFNKLKSYNEHLSGKRHDAVIAESNSVWADYVRSGPRFFDPSVSQQEVTRAWSLDLFMDGLQARSRSSIKHVLVSGVAGGQLDPSLRLDDLCPPKRAALWRFLHTSRVPGMASMISALPPQYVRVKEILESIETFHHVERLMKRSVTRGEKAKKISHIYDVGCGHGLVGMLCAAAFPHITVHAIDLVPRDSFQAQREAFEASGTSLDNLSFEAGDLSTLKDCNDDNMNQDGNSEECNNERGHSLLLCVHGCKSLTHESIELAEKNKWAWLSVPCCLQSENHLDERTTLKVPDNTRFTMLCGAIAAKYQTETVTTIDSRITARGIVLASSGRQ